MKQRRFQQEFIDNVVLKAEEWLQQPLAKRQPFIMVGDIYPGSGKTRTYLQAADTLFKMDLIDTLLILVPRLNLAMQVERSWKDHREEFQPDALGFINHRENKWPLIREGESGYVTTYQSLIANPALHHDQLKGRRLLLALDEAQQLGADYLGSQAQANTTSAEEVQRLVTTLDVIGVMVMTGTPFRADSSRLLFAEYQPGADGLDYLRADVTATYSDGIEGGYLRPFEANLVDGEVDWKEPNQELETLTLSDYDRSLRTFLNDSPGFWQGMVECFVDHLQERQAVDGRFCGLIACYNQDQANRVSNYLHQHHRGLRVLKAISEDGEAAQQNLTRFQAEHFDVLVTVQMAYVGYDQPWISVVLPLTGVREPGYLRQLFARSLRVVTQVAYARQVAVWVVPADARMKAFIEAERQERDRGLRRREIAADPDETPMIPLPSHEAGWAVDGRITTQSAMGWYAEGDVTPDEMPLIEHLISEMNLPITPSYAKAFLARYEQARQQPATAGGQPTVVHNPTQREQEKAALDALHISIADVTHQVSFFRRGAPSQADRGRAQRAIRLHLKNDTQKAASALTVDEIAAQIATVRGWLQADHVPDAVVALYRRLV